MSNLVKYRKEPIVKLNRNVVLTPEMVGQLILDWGNQTRRYKELHNYYMGNHEILNRAFADTTKPNNKLVNNFASYITDVRNGYFTGTPITYISKDQTYLKKLDEVFTINNESDITSELDKISNIKGHAFELLWTDENGDIRFKYVDPDEMIMIYSSDIAEVPIYAIRYYNEVSLTEKEKITRRVYLYDMEYVTEFLMTEQGKGFAIDIVDTYPHYFGEVPVIEYINNSDRTGSFEDVVSLIDAYNISQSDSVNEIQYFNDAYLKLKNMSATDVDDIAKMKENRVLLVEGDGDAEWLTKNVNDSYLENLKERISKDIHKFSKTPNLVSEDFISNLSGTAIRYKVWGLEQDTAKKERKWRQTLQKRIQLITRILNTKGATFDPALINMTFNRNLPQNVMELGQMVSQLRGSVSNETLLGQLPFVDNVVEEMDRLKKEQKENTFSDYKIPNNIDNNAKGNLEDVKKTNLEE